MHVETHGHTRRVRVCAQPFDIIVEGVVLVLAVAVVFLKVLLKFLFAGGCSGNFQRC